MLKIIAVLSVLAIAQAVEVRQCPEGYPKPEDVMIEGCDVMPCVLNRGTNVTIESEALALEELTAMTISVIVLWNGIEVEMPLDEPNACNLIVPPASCPFQEGDVVPVRTSIVIPQMLPEADIILTTQIKNQHDSVFACFEGDFIIL